MIYRTVLLTHIPEYMRTDDTRLTFASNDVAYVEENMNDDLTKITVFSSAFDRLPSFTIDSNSLK